MTTNPLAPARLESAAALDKPATKLQEIVHKIPEGRVRDGLHGVWLGHPLHPALTDAVIGAWTSAAILDAVPAGDGTDDAASVLTAAGLAMAVPTVVTGWIDWADLDRPQRRVGIVHALGNTVAAGCYLGSLVARVSGRRALGRVLGLAGLASATAAGALGGHLAFRMRAGVDHSAGSREGVGPGWHPLAELADLPESKPVRRTVDGVALVVVRRGRRVDVLADACSHAGGPLSEGEVDGECVRCPWHGSAFRLIDGSVAHGPATAPAPVFRTRMREGTVELTADT